MASGILRQAKISTALVRISYLDDEMAAGWILGIPASVQYLKYFDDFIVPVVEK